MPYPLPGREGWGLVMLIWSLTLGGIKASDTCVAVFHSSRVAKGPLTYALFGIGLADRNDPAGLAPWARPAGKKSPFSPTSNEVIGPPGKFGLNEPDFGAVSSVATKFFGAVTVIFDTLLTLIAPTVAVEATDNISFVKFAVSRDPPVDWMI